MISMQDIIDAIKSISGRWGLGNWPISSLDASDR
jgi:hypothetical protein